MFRLLRLPFLAAALLFSLPANADVNVTFYSHEFGKNFPHAFFVIKGKLDSGELVDTNYGFTAVNVSPGILWGSVKGKIETSKVKYVANSNPHFTVTIADAKYHELMALVKKWRDMPQKSYSLNKRNCVHFVGEAIRLLGFRINAKTKNWKKPTSFMREVLTLNPGLVN
ncbi:hypothetical protein MNBD_ALPHA04-2084 [hydrothermal vent metagenome]|uniref:DUF4105 domain-containing protein n=1 Tax=hydrothermal vent metagenome TaxID=652676 RepID=A0A3B0RTS1_9ZZZZ